MMQKINQKGQIFILFLFFMIAFAFAAAALAQFSKIVFSKMKLQGALDRGVFAAASLMTEMMNEWVLENRKAYELFLELEKDFKNVSQPNLEKPKDRVRRLWADQNRLYDAMSEKTERMLSLSFEIAENELQKEIPNARLVPLYAVAPTILDGPKKDFAFDKINGGILFDPTGHQKIGKTELEGRMAFVKDASAVVAFAAGAEWDFPHWKSTMRAVSAAQPFGGSVWNGAFQRESGEVFCYQTAFVPLSSLPHGGFLKGNENWRNFDPSQVQH